MDEEDNPFRTEKPNIDPLMSVDLNASILSAERQKSNIVSNPWEISEGEDILKSIMEIKNKKPDSPPINDTMYPIMKNDNVIDFNTDFGSASTPNFRVNDPWAVPQNTSNSLFNAKNNDNSFTSLNLNAPDNTFTSLNLHTPDNTKVNNSNKQNNNDNNNMSSSNSTMLASATTNTSQSSIKSPINYTNNSQSIAITNFFNFSEDADVITVRISPEKSGVVFKHVNYLIHSKLHKMSTIRRYSDFFWLYEILCKRYQYRIMINIPPKHLGSSTHDLAFLEKRRRGLSRFINYVANHPVMKNDEFYKNFINKDFDMYAIRKNNNLEVTDEFEMTYLSPEQISMIPIEFEKNLENLKTGLKFLADQYEALYNSMEKISNNLESSSNEYTNIGYSLGQMSEFKDFLGFDSYNFKLLYNGYARLADGFQKISSVLHENYQNTINSIVESLQTQKEIIDAFDHLLLKKDAFSSKISVNIAQIDKRIKVTTDKLLDKNIKDMKDKEKEKLEILVTQDQKDKSVLERKLQFIRYCIFSEANFLEAQKMQIANMYSEYIQMQIRIISMLHDEWKILSVAASKLPVGSF
ncbi:hypothetical protein BCR32DRAFT_271797 [Anaeromyces robustus]|uniref:Sorting nexin MVP1 n=1 Tax=Anaeromyces robustus TaxID=1754192 RepID=A0A1Y1WQ21_9FUNG|nr:hypothetical protein BCR32DRAFT_271797 [Anaeromyces robustus]|eukprot:ORX75623.1 hypothetical protein BCR32DRAFT_271797 [Anaeromyces robustus]